MQLFLREKRSKLADEVANKDEAVFKFIFTHDGKHFSRENEDEMQDTRYSFDRVHPSIFLTRPSPGSKKLFQKKSFI